MPAPFCGGGHAVYQAVIRAKDRTILERPDVLSLPALRPFGYVEFDTLALLQAAEAACLDGREMHKYIFATLTADKAIAFGVVKPLYCSLFCHFVACILLILFTLKGSRRYKGQDLLGVARSCSTTDSYQTQHNSSRDAPLCQHFCGGTSDVGAVLTCPGLV